MTDEIRRIDRHYAGATDLHEGLYGYAHDHRVELDFGERLRGLSTAVRPILVLYGTTEYPYSSTNYAASLEGLRMKPPSIHVWRDGRWEEVLHEVGCPAGMQHIMTVELTGKILPSDRRLSISSNMEIYWDRIFVGVHLDHVPLQLQEIACKTPISTSVATRNRTLPTADDPNCTIMTAWTAVPLEADARRVHALRTGA